MLDGGESTTSAEESADNMQESHPQLPASATADDVQAYVKEHKAQYHLQVEEPKIKKRRVQLKDPDARKQRDNQRNKEHAKVSRLRKKFFVESLEEQLAQMQNINRTLREKVSQFLPPKEHLPLINECNVITQHSLQDEVQGRLDEDETPSSKSAKGSSASKRKRCSAFSLKQLQLQNGLHLALSSPDGRFLSASEGLENLTGYTASELLSRTEKSLHCNVTSKAQILRTNELLESGQRDVTSCLLHCHKEGYPYLTARHVVPTHNKKQEVVQRITIFTEVPATTMAGAFLNSIKKDSKARAEAAIYGKARGQSTVSSS